ncbi:hypothetical protein [Fodinibius saliphilus]|uniref:hypothetical protein n=1 Tax=Fodinibius saliphilus TaxID=1920650 RepID=UPI0011089D4C|nr:hypothetical protein [Fodinibius saliphilus]
MNLILTLENFEKALAEIIKVDSVKDGNTMIISKNFIEKLIEMVNMQSVRLHLESAQKNYVYEKKIVEKDFLFSAYRKIKASKMTNKDLRVANLQDYTTGQNLTSAGIEQRLMELGWKG